MKNKISVICLAIFILLRTASINAQSNTIKNNNDLNLSGLIELSIIENPTTRLTDNEHVYVLKAVNKTNDAIEIQIIAENINCDGKMNVSFEHKIFQENNQVDILDNLKDIKISANSSVIFYIKLINSSNIKLNSWNCTEIKAIGFSGKILSNKILIESFIPNPKDFR